MAQNYGLGRGLASLIPQKQKNTITEPKDDFSYFGAKPAASSLQDELKNKVLVGNSGDTLSGSGVQEIEIIGAMATAWTQGDMALPGSITAEAVFHFLSKIGLAEEAAEAEDHRCPGRSEKRASGGDHDAHLRPGPSLSARPGRPGGPGRGRLDP